MSHEHAAGDDDSALRASEQRFRQLAETLAAERAALETAQRVAKVGSWETDYSTLAVRWSAETYRLFGLDPTSFRPTHESFLSYVHPDDRAIVDAAFRDSFDTRDLCTVTHRIVLADGAIKHVEERWRTFVDASGRPARAIGTCQDITERREAEIAVERSESLLHVASSTGRIGAFRVEFASGERYWSEELGSLFDLPKGYTPPLDEALGFYEPEARARMRARYERCAREGVGYDEELEAVTVTGRRIWVRTIGQAILDEHGKVVGLQGAVQDITDRHLADEALHRSEERFRAAFAAAPVGMILIAPGGRYLEANDAYCTMLGFTLAELRDRTFAEVTHPDDVDAITDAGAELRSGREHSVTFQKRYLTRDGRTIWARVSLTAQRDHDGSVSSFIGVVEDISAARTAQEALRASEERFRILAMATNDASYDWDIASDVLSWNEGFERLFGFARAELEPTSVSWNERVHEGDRYRILEHLHATIESHGRFWTGEYRFRRKDGGYAHVLDRGYIVRDATGRALRMIGGITDLTLRKEAELRLAQQAALLDAAHDAIIVKDLDDRITYWNKGAERTYGWPAEEVLGHTAESLFHVDRERYGEARARLATHGLWEGELHKRGRDGVDRTVGVRWTLVNDEHERPGAVFAIDTDVTERKRLEAQFFRGQRLESLGTLAGGIAHDLNNVLTPILVSIELLRMGESDPQQLETLNTIEASALRGAEMVRQVLSFARGAEGRRLRVDLRRIARDIEAIVHETFPKDISLRLEIDPHLWPITGDETQVHQVLMNLCVNARDAMPQGGVLSVSLANSVLDDVYSGMHPEARPGSYVRLVVADTGLGIPPAVLERVFEPFFTTKEHGKGTGLGLSTVHSIVRAHKGSVHVYSEPGKGARFSIYLPALDGPQSEDTIAEPGHLPRGHGERILVVDDEEGIRTIVQRTLERFGYRVMLAANGAEAVALYEQHRADIAAVLTDMAMPVMDGPSMIVALKALDPAVRIMGSSGLTTRDGVIRAMGEGVDHFVPKPYTAETLLTTLREVLGT